MRCFILFAAGIAAAAALSGCGGATQNADLSSSDFFVTSPDGKQVVYKKLVNGVENDLWIGENDNYEYEDSGVVEGKMLFDSSFAVGSIAWSPDSSKVAFVDNTAAHAPGAPSVDRLLVIEVKTGKARVLVTEDGSRITRILIIEKWTDDDQIIFAANGFVQDCTQGPCRDLTPYFEVKADGTGLRQIAP